MSWDPLPKTDRIFETHQNFRMYLGTQEEGDHHVGGLRMSKVPVYMLERQDDIAQSVKYPFEAVGDLIGRTQQGTPYLESSIAYMVALAILEGVDKLAIYGVDLHCDTEYAYQRPNLEYLIGFARGRGIKVIIPPQSALITHQNGVPYGFWQQPDAPPIPERK